MAKFSMKLEGARELLRDLKALKDEIEREIVVETIQDAAAWLQAEVRKRVPVVSGLTRDAITVVPGKMKRGRVSFKVMIGEGDYKGETFYAAFLEFGHFLGKRSESIAAESKRQAAQLRREARKAKALHRKGTDFRRRQETYFKSEGHSRALKTTKERTWVEAQPFIRPAFHENREKLVEQILESLRKRIEAAAR